MSFKERISKGDLAQQEWVDYFRSKHLAVSKVGYENSPNINNFKDTIIKLEDPTSLLIRHYPDLAISIKQSFYMDIKAGETIEKNSYNSLLFLSQKSNVYIGFPNLKYINIKKLNLYLKPRPLIIKDGWYEPRLLSPEEYQKWKGKTGGSGTPFKDIDISNLKQIKDRDERLDTTT